MSFKNYFFVFVLSVAGQSMGCNAADRKIVVGVTDSGVFTPLLKVKPGVLSRVDTQDLEGSLITLVDGGMLTLGSAQRIIDHHAAKGEVLSYMVDSNIYSLAYSGSLKNSLSLEADQSDYASVITYLFEQPWTKSFLKFESSPEKISMFSQVGILGVTDINGDGAKEFWLSYKTMYDQVALQVVTVESGGASKVLDFCLACD
jgi:hypothetical protein